MDDRPLNLHQIMESKTEFDLNHNIQCWRLTLANSPSFQQDNLDELELHIRDSVNTLESKGLSTEESFMIAVRRLGHPTALEKEFGKVNTGTVWLSRWTWMALGTLLFVMVQSARGALTYGVLVLGKCLALNAHVIGFFIMVATLLLFVAPLIFLRRVAAPSPKPRNRFITRTILKYPVISITALIIFTIGMPLLSIVGDKLIWGGPLNPERLALAQATATWSILPGMVAQYFILPMLVVYLCRRHLKARLVSA